MPLTLLDGDVPFDSAAAAVFVECCERAEALLERATVERWAEGNRALAHCVGPFADQLATELAARCDEAAQLAEALAVLRRRVVTAQAEAMARTRALAAIRAAATHAAQVDAGDFLQAGRS